MWKCIKCRERIGDDLDVCWNCGASRDGIEDPDFRKADDFVPPTEGSPRAMETTETALREGEPPPPGKQHLACLRCGAKLRHAGAKEFHEGTNWGVFGEFGEL